MTHSLHRRGDQESLRRDYVVLCMSAGGINDEGSSKSLRQAFEITKKFKTVNMGNMRHGNIYMKNMTFDMLTKRIGDRSIIHAVFNDKSEAFDYIESLKESGLGMSVVLSGLFDEVFDGCKGVSVKPHTMNFSLGTFGRTDLLPEEDILWITTMCGHHQVSPRFVEDMVRKVRAQKITPEDAGKELARLCICGIFNPVRAAEIIREIAEK